MLGEAKPPQTLKSIFAFSRPLTVLEVAPKTLAFPCFYFTNQATLAGKSKNPSSLILLLSKNFSYFARGAKAPVSLGVSLPPRFLG